MSRVKLVLAYVGTGFAGWQLQASPDSPQPRTVQGELEKALEKLLGQPVRVHGSGRTDSGVHADMQVAHFDIPARFAQLNWAAALPRFLPEDLGVLEAQLVQDDFHARFSATGKVYTYSIWLGVSPVPPRLKPFVWGVRGLDLALMAQAAQKLLGEHDFAAFQNSGSKVTDTVRTLHGIEQYPLALPGEKHIAPDSPLRAWRFEGNGFLKQMVRNLMGFMAAVGQGKLRAEDADLLFAAKNRSALHFPTAPAQGLSLTQVLY